VCGHRSVRRIAGSLIVSVRRSRTRQRVLRASSTVPVAFLRCLSLDAVAAATAAVAAVASRG